MTSTKSNAESSAPSLPANDSPSLDSLIKDFMTGVRDTDWLKQNTAEKWELENPGLALEYRNAIKATTGNHGDGGNIVGEPAVKETPGNESPLLKAKKDTESSGLLKEICK